MHTIIHSICGKPSRPAAAGAAESLDWRGFAGRSEEEIESRPMTPAGGTVRMPNHRQLFMNKRWRMLQCGKL